MSYDMLGCCCLVSTLGKAWRQRRSKARRRFRSWTNIWRSFKMDRVRKPRKELWFSHIFTVKSKEHLGKATDRTFKGCAVSFGNLQFRVSPLQFRNKTTQVAYEVNCERNKTAASVWSEPHVSKQSHSEWPSMVALENHAGRSSYRPC